MWSWRRSIASRRAISMTSFARSVRGIITVARLQSGWPRVRGGLFSAGVDDVRHLFPLHDHRLEREDDLADGLALLVAAEERPEDRDVAQDRQAAAQLGLLLLHEPAEPDLLPALHRHLGLRLPVAERGRRQPRDVHEAGEALDRGVDLQLDEVRAHDVGPHLQLE